MANLTTCLTLNGRAEEAAEFYARVFDTAVSAVIPDGQGATMLCTLQILGHDVVILNMGDDRASIVSPKVTMQVHVDGQAEFDRYWDALLEGGEPSQCGWLTDKYGVWWNIVPEQMKQLTVTASPAGMARMAAGVRTMQRVDIAELQRLASDDAPA